MANYINIAYDCGQGNGKMVGPDGWAILESYASRKNKESVSSELDGLKSQRAHMAIELPNGRAFYVGRNAHAAGDPVDPARLAGHSRRALSPGGEPEHGCPRDQSAS